MKGPGVGGGERTHAVSWAACVTAIRRSGHSHRSLGEGELRGAINAFAAGALLVMLVDSMIPDATRQSGRAAGLVTTLGFAVAAGLSIAS